MNTHIAEHAENVYWRDPLIDKPPRATKLVVMTPGGIAQIGTWSDGLLAWHPLIKKPQWLKERLEAAYASGKWRTSHE
jgi:hypothetical protein